MSKLQGGSGMVLPPGLPPAPTDAAGLANCAAHAVVEAAQPGDPLVVTFGFAHWDKPATFDFVGRLRKVEGLLGRRFHRIHVRDPQRCWYLRGVPGLGADVVSTAASLARAIDALQPSRVITLGQSMGGYGAILFGRLLKANRIVVFGALSTMEPAVSRSLGDSRWLPVMQALEDEGFLGVAPDLAAAPTPGGVEMRMHYGERSDSPQHVDKNLDLFHARRFAALSECSVTLHSDAGHAVAEHLRRTHALDACLLRDLFDIEPSLVHRRAHAVLDDGWLRWIAENLLQQCSAESMLVGMTNAGVNPISARSAIAMVERDPILSAARSFVALTKKYESVLVNQQRVSELGNQAPT